MKGFIFGEDDPFDKMLLFYFKLMAVVIIIGVIIEICIWIGVLNSVPELLHAISSRLMK